MKTILFVVALLLSVSTLFSQRRVALQSNGVTTIFDGGQPFVEAYNNAVTGDTIYLPGGQLASPGSFDKGIVIFGAGLRSDTSMVTEKTKISGFSLNAGADKFYLEGVYVDGSITFQNNSRIDSVVIRRSLVTNTINVQGTNKDCQGIKIDECVVLTNLNLENAKSPEITNSILRSITSVENGYIANNIIVSNSSARALTSVHQSLIENNIIANTYYNYYLYANCINNSFVNNSINDDLTSDATNSWNNNYMNTLPTDVLVDFVWLFDEAANYHVTDPVSFQGTTGGEIGIYGGLQPASEGFKPQNPHFQVKEIASQTDLNGELEVKIKIEAQND